MYTSSAHLRKGGLRPHYSSCQYCYLQMHRTWRDVKRQKTNEVNWRLFTGLIINQSKANLITSHAQTSYSNVRANHAGSKEVGINEEHFALLVSFLQRYNTIML